MRRIRLLFLPNIGHFPAIPVSTVKLLLHSIRHSDFTPAANYKSLTRVFLNLKDPLSCHAKDDQDCDGPRLWSVLQTSFSYILVFIFLMCGQSFFQVNSGQYCSVRFYCVFSLNQMSRIRWALFRPVSNQKNKTIFRV